MTWIQDSAFIRGNIPMTKFDVRAVTMALLDIEPGDTLLDVGAGSGSISIQAALLGASVCAVEQEVEGIEIIRRNAQKFQVEIDLFHGSAPQILNEVPACRKCFIGGSKGRLSQIFHCVHQKLCSQGILVANFIKLENMSALTTLLNDHHYRDVDVRLLQTARVDHLGLLRGQNPVFLVKGEKP